MPSLPFLDYQLPLYTQHLEGWKREERRLYGGDAVLEELALWKGEDEEHLALRKAQARYLTFPKIHASTLTGHLSQNTPVPSFGRLGPEVRSREKIDKPNLAELLYYNVDGIGQDGTEFPVWFDGVQERAIATGYRWIMVEMPGKSVLQAIRGTREVPDPNRVTMEERIAGFRPYAVEYSPISVPFWQLKNGRLDCAVVRIPVERETLVDAGGALLPPAIGYYLLVRRGFVGLGQQWASGGWWKFDEKHELLDAGTWDQTKGEIPMFLFVGEPSHGTTERPAIARSLTMELGQIAVGLMHRISEREYNASQAAKSVNWILGIKPDQHAETIAQLEDGSIVVGIPPVMADDGTVLVPSLWNSSAALLDAQAYDTIITGGIEEAGEIMVRQVTSTPDSSGESKRAGFAEATSPLLARLAASRQQAINTFLYFASLRLGVDEPNASVTIPREFDLAPIVDEIDAMLDTLKRSSLSSPTWESDLILKAGEERGVLPEEKRQQIEAELKQSMADNAEAAARERDLTTAFPAPPALDGGAGDTGAGDAEAAA